MSHSWVLKRVWISCSFCFTSSVAERVLIIWLKISCLCFITHHYAWISKHQLRNSKSLHMQACFVCVVLLFNPDLSKAVTQYLSVGSTPLFGLWSVWYQHVTFSMINVSIKRPLGAHLNKTVNKSILSFFYSGFPRETTELKFRLDFFFSFGRKPQSSPHHAFATFWAWRMREFLTNEHTGWCNGGRRKTFAAQN